MNLYQEKGTEAVQDKIRNAFHAIFEDEQTRFYFDGPDDDCGYMLDTGNVDARTEGMSYGMMMPCRWTDRTCLTDFGAFPCGTCCILKESMRGISPGR